MIISITTETTTLIIDDVDTNESQDNEWDTKDDENDENDENETNEKILYFFTEKTIWYLIVGVFATFIIVIMGCCILYYRYRILLQKTKHSTTSKEENMNFREKEMSPSPQVAAIKYHYNKNNVIGYAFKDKKSPSSMMNDDNEEDICLVPQQFDVGSDNATQSVSSTIVSPQLTSKVSLPSVSDIGSVVNNDDLNSRRSIKIVEPQYYPHRESNNNNNKNNIMNTRNSNNSILTDTSNYEQNYLEKENSDSNESMYDPTLSNSHIERTATATNDGDNTNE